MKGFLLFLASLFVLPFVMLAAIKGKYPSWMITPDDTKSPFGQYEETVRRVYKLGRYVGDVYWLGIRDRLFGLSYHYKPDFLKGLTDYTNLTTFRDENRTYLIYNGKTYTETIRKFGPLQVISGYRISPIHDGKQDPHPEINMDGRPIFSIRRAE